jgi:hypothetical protein
MIDPADVKSDFLDRQREVFRERIEFIESLMRELPILHAALDALDGTVAKPQLEFERKPEPMVGAKRRESPNGGPGKDTSGETPDRMVSPASTNGRRKPHVKVKVEQVRDWVVGQTEPFTLHDVAQALDISTHTARRKLRSLPKGMVQPTRSRAGGGHPRWEYVAPSPTRGPHRRPRGEDRGPRNAVAPVPHTGRPKGPSDKPGAGKPGQLRRKKKGGQIMRIGGKQ